MAAQNVEVGTVAVSALTEDWDRGLKSAPALIHVMGICAALSTKSEILQMQLDDKRLENKGLLSNLLHLCNHGQSSFQQAHGDTYKIAVRAEEIGRAEGCIDKIIKNFGKSDPRARRRLERALSTLEEQVKLSKAEGAMTNEAFKEWGAKTNILREAVISERVKTGKTLQEKEGYKIKVEANCKVAEGDMLIAETELEHAVKATERAHKAASETSKDSQTPGSYLTRSALGAVTMGIGLVIWGIIDGINVYQKHQDVRLAESKVQLKSTIFSDLKRKLLILQSDVTIVESEAKRWSAVCQAVDVTLNNLTALQHHVQEMVQYFNDLSNHIELLSERCNEKFRELAQEEGDSDGEADSEDLKELLDQARQVKILALVINAKAKTYASVSRNELLQGFQLVSRLTNRGPSLLDDTEYMERSAGDLAVYQHNAELGISISTYKSKLRLFEECKIIYPTLSDSSPLNPANQAPPSL